MIKVNNRHILFELRGCPSELLDNEEFIRLCLYTAAKESNSELIHISAHKFSPQGVTGLAMLADSHMSIHTWPEKNLAMCDIFTYGVDATPMKAVEYLCKQFQSKDLTYSHHERI